MERYLVQGDIGGFKRAAIGVFLHATGVSGVMAWRHFGRGYLSRSCWTGRRSKWPVGVVSCLIRWVFLPGGKMAMG